MTSATGPRAPEGGDITRLLERWHDGDQQALEELTPRVYEQLRRLAHAQMQDERAGHLLQTTALVHEAFLRLLGLEAPPRHRRHFFAVAAGTMRRVLVDFARRRDAVKRGGGAVRVSLAEVEPTIDAMQSAAMEMLAFDHALGRLEERDARKARVIELRCLVGLTIEETAQVLEVSHTTIEKDWKMARAWLARQLGRSAP
jgi:RNA polymerase sigma factor (TIGR02999 family)